jgi:hypothetical protein
VQKILIQLDSDPQPSVFDRVVAIDAGADQVFSYGGVVPEEVRDLVYGAMFTRAPADLKSTAVFVGGKDVAAAEQMLKQIQRTFFGPVRVSVMIDANGSNTTAAAAVLAARKHVDLAGCQALVLGGTGPVGERAALLLAREGAAVRVASRSRDRAASVCARLVERVPAASFTPVATGEPEELNAAVAGVVLVIAAGAAGVIVLPASVRTACSTLRVAIDLNAVPPLGIEGIEPGDKAIERGGAICYGAIGVGGLKMKIHKAALARLFEVNNVVLDAEEIYKLGATLA